MRYRIISLALALLAVFTVSAQNLKTETVDGVGAKVWRITADRAANYHADSQGTAVVFEAVCRSIGHVRAGMTPDADWNESINADYNGRKKRNR